MAVQLLSYDDLVLFLRSLTYRSLGSRELAQRPQADLERKIELYNQLLASKTWVWGPHV